MKKIVLTGGGTSGHVTPNIALLDSLKNEGYEVVYIGSKQGIERELIQKENIKYYPISSGKLRRYFDFKNFIDPFKVLIGYFEARKILKKEKVEVLFSKGGFVSVPVVIAAKHLKIPVIIHESDISPGLANKLSVSSAKYICTNFPETLKYFKNKKAICVGSPIRKDLFTGDIQKAKKILGFCDDKQVIMVFGGSLGSVAINKALRDALENLLERFNIIHICGKGNLDKSLNNKIGYKQFEYVREEMKHFLALADLVISRAGANSLAEILALKKLNLLIPLSLKASRGDQILNAKSYKSQGYSEVLEEEDLNKESLLDKINFVLDNKDIFIKNLNNNKMNNAIEEILKLIKSL